MLKKVTEGCCGLMNSLAIHRCSFKRQFRDVLVHERSIRACTITRWTVMRQGWLEDFLSQTSCTIADKPDRGGYIHCLTKQSRSPSAKGFRSFWEGTLTRGFHLRQRAPKGLRDQPCERQTRTPIHGVSQTIDKITGETDRKSNHSRLWSFDFARFGIGTSVSVAFIVDRGTRSGLIRQRHYVPL